jgi:hypothetical protein
MTISRGVGECSSSWTFSFLRDQVLVEKSWRVVETESGGVGGVGVRDQRQKGEAGEAHGGKPLSG